MGALYSPDLLQFLRICLVLAIFILLFILVWAIPTIPRLIDEFRKDPLEGTRYER